MSGPYETQGTGSGGKTVLIVVSIICGTLLIVALACGGIIFLAFRAIERVAEEIKPALEEMREQEDQNRRATEVMTDFLDHLRADRLDAAYALTSAAFQKQVSRDDFDRLIDRYPFLKQQGAMVQLKVDRPAGKQQPLALKQFRWQFSAHAKDGKRFDVILAITEEEGAMKVSEFSAHGAAEAERP